MAPAKKAVPASKKPSPDQPAEQPPGGDFCPEPGACFPDGIPDTSHTAGCVHGTWELGE